MTWFGMSFELSSSNPQAGLDFMTAQSRSAGVKI
jgi:hypothetical protein